MSGRRLLDAAAIFKASRAIASRHVNLRQKQIDTYGKTSALAKAIKVQTDRITLTWKAASVLVDRFNGNGSNFSTQAYQSAKRTDDTGIGQDHFYTASAENETKDKAPSHDVNVKQERAGADPLPDGTILARKGGEVKVDSETESFSIKSETEPPIKPLSTEEQGDKENIKPRESGRSSIPEPVNRFSTSSADEARKAQSLAEVQIPSQTANPPAAHLDGDRNALIRDQGHKNPVVNQDQDVFYEPPKTDSRVLSSLPRVKLPKNTEIAQESDDNVPDDQINQDVFYSSKSGQSLPSQEQAIPDKQAVPENEELPEQMYSELFHSRKVSQMLRGQPNESSPSKGLDLSAAESLPESNFKAPIEMDESNPSLRAASSVVSRKSSPSTASKIQENDEVQTLAIENANESHRTVHDNSDVQVDVGVERVDRPKSYEMRQSRVPSSRISRLWQYGGLATSMAFGAVGESLRRASGSGEESGNSLMLSAHNMERLVAKLSRMRGAALKLGQMMSFQDSKMLPKPIHEVLQRVQDSADYMPSSQRDRVLASNLGPEWRSLFSRFDEAPIAAASIGQVHSAVIATTNQQVAVKVQYPGVASSIDSDLSNLAILLTASRLLPKGLFLDKTIANARTELAWECDYIREAEMGRRFKEILGDESDVYHVPTVITEASGPQVLTAEYAHGIGVTKAQNFSQEQRDWIGTNILRLCLREITEFKFMQTDPNWTNFLFNSSTQKLELLDFGASREFPDRFIIPYVRTLLAASRGDRAQVRDLSIELGYLTGHESQAMEKAHVDSVLTLAEPFAKTAPEVYDFRDQTITDRVRGFIPVMVRERLSPPPEETYSLHRKLSGAFLLCARLGARIRCRQIFRTAIEKAGMA